MEIIYTRSVNFSSLASRLRYITLHWLVKTIREKAFIFVERRTETMSLSPRTTEMACLQEEYANANIYDILASIQACGTFCWIMPRRLTR